MEQFIKTLPDQHKLIKIWFKYMVLFISESLLEDFGGIILLQLRELYREWSIHTKFISEGLTENL